MTKNRVISISNYSGKWASADANEGCINLGLAVAQKGEQVLVQAALVKILNPKLQLVHPSECE